MRRGGIRAGRGGDREVDILHQGVAELPRLDRRGEKAGFGGTRRIDLGRIDLFEPSLASRSASHTAASPFTPKITNFAMPRSPLGGSRLMWIDVIGFHEKYNQFQ